jgi:hypothetical protein
MGREGLSHDSVDKDLNAMGRRPMAFFLGLNNFKEKENNYETSQSTFGRP